MIISDQRDKRKKTEIAVEVRRNDILNLMLSGMTHASLIKHYTITYPQLGRSSLEKDITWAYENISKHVMEDAKSIITKHIALYDKIIEESINDSYSRETAIKAMSAKEKLLKMHSPTTAVQINNNNLDLSHLTVEELNKLLKT
jgi:hypothetical protein